jgi:hypothetical protein
VSSARRIPVYRGHFGPEQAERLLWRAGFGPRPGEEKRLAKKGLHGAVHSLTHPKRDRLTGPKPVDDDGHPIAPIDAWGHDHLWWLDRMVRSNRQLVERMTLVWHDWFATSNAGVGSQRLMLSRTSSSAATRSARSSSSSSRDEDPAMLLWLNGTDNDEGRAERELRREMMELFTLGASRGYTERDVREQARALTGWRNDWDDDKGPVNFRFDPKRHDTGTKRSSASAGTSTGRTRAGSRSTTRSTARSSSRSSGATSSRRAARGDARALQALYVRHTTRSARSSRRSSSIRRSTTARAWSSPRSSISPGCCARDGAGSTPKPGRGSRARPASSLFYPPNVAGWDDTRWLDTASFLARWNLAGRVLRPSVLKTKDEAPLNAEKLLDRALAYWGHPRLTPPTKRALKSFAHHAITDADRKWKKDQYPPLIENALRHLIAVSPDQQTS